MEKLEIKKLIFSFFFFFHLQKLIFRGKIGQSGSMHNWAIYKFYKQSTRYEVNLKALGHPHLGVRFPCSKDGFVGEMPELLASLNFRMSYKTPAIVLQLGYRFKRSSQLFQIMLCWTALYFKAIVTVECY